MELNPYIFRTYLPEMNEKRGSSSIELVPTVSKVPSLEMVPWNTRSYLCHHFWRYYLSFPRSHQWRWFLEIYGPISATTFGAGIANNKASTPELAPTFSKVPSLEMIPWNTVHGPSVSLPPFLEQVAQITGHQLQSWFLPFPRFHLWRWFLVKIHGLISGTIFGAGSANDKVSTPELAPAFFKVPSLEMIPWNTRSYLCHHFWSWWRK